MVEGVTVEFVHEGVGVPVVEDVSFSVGAGEVVGLVGEIFNAFNWATYKINF